MSTSRLKRPLDGCLIRVLSLLNGGADVNAYTNINCSDKNNWTVLHHASYEGWLAIAQALVNEKGIDLNAKTHELQTPLMFAAEQNQLNIVKLLLRAGANINCCDGNNWTVLHHTSWNGRFAITKTLVDEKGIDVNVKTDVGDTPLLLATKKGHSAIVQLLLTAGANFHCCDERNWTVLHHASYKGYLTIARALVVKDGIDVNAKTCEGEMPLMIAAKLKNPDVVELLLRAGADIDCRDDKNWSVLHHASWKGWLTIAQILVVEKGIDREKLNELNIKKESPLKLAAIQNHPDVFELLLNAGASVETHDEHKRTVLHCASCGGGLRIVQSLLKRGIDVNAESDRGETSLILAAKHGRRDVVELLISAGANINNCDVHNWTVLHYASCAGWREIVQSLLTKGIDVNAVTCEGKTALTLAAHNNAPDVVELLLKTERVVDVNRCSPDRKMTVLHHASWKGWFTIAQTLLKKKAVVNARATDDNTPLYLACKFYNKDIIELLLNSGADSNAEVDGYSAFRFLIRVSSEGDLLRLCIENGAYFDSKDYDLLLKKPFLKKCILQDIKLCSKAMLNKFNNKDLPKLYKSAAFTYNLPCIKKMRIVDGNKKVIQDVEQAVEHEVITKGECDLMKACPLVLSMLSVRSFLNYVDNLTKSEYGLQHVKKS